MSYDVMWRHMTWYDVMTSWTGLNTPKAVSLLVEHVLMVCMCRSIMAKGLWSEGTLQHRSQEVRQRSGVFMVNSLISFAIFMHFVTASSPPSTPPLLAKNSNVGLGASWEKKYGKGLATFFILHLSPFKMPNGISSIHYLPYKYNHYQLTPRS